MWRWPETFFRNFLPVLVQEGFATEADQDEFFHDWEQRSADPGAVFSTPPMLDIIAVKK